MRRNGAPEPEPEPEMDMDNPLYAGGRQSMGGPPDDLDLAQAALAGKGSFAPRGAPPLAAVQQQPPAGVVFETEDAPREGSTTTFDVEGSDDRAPSQRNASSGLDRLFTPPALQDKCRQLVHTKLFESIITAIVVLNTAALAIKGPNRVLSESMASAIELFDLGCTLLYTLEMVARISAFGAWAESREMFDDDDDSLQRKALLRDPWGRLDFFVIMTTWVSYIIEWSGYTWLVKTSMLRSLRVLRILHSIQYFKAIRAILTSLQHSVEYSKHAFACAGSVGGVWLRVRRCARSGGRGPGAVFPLRAVLDRGHDAFRRGAAHAVRFSGGGSGLCGQDGRRAG